MMISLSTFVGMAFLMVAITFPICAIRAKNPERVAAYAKSVLSISFKEFFTNFLKKETPKE